MILYFSAAWCAECKVMTPLVERLEKDLPEVKIQKIDADARPELRDAYHILGVPAFVLIPDDMAHNAAETAPLELARAAGVMRYEELKNFALSLRVFRAGGRTELAGNHTDHNFGKALAATVQLACTAWVVAHNGTQVVFKSKGYDDVTVDIADTQKHSEEYGKTEALIRGIAAKLRERGISPGGFTAYAENAVPTGAGLSSSAAIEVLLVRIFMALNGGAALGVTEIAKIGQYAENVYFGKPCGLLDQISSAADGTVAIDFSPLAVNHDGLPKIEKFCFDPRTYGFALCVTNTGGSHAGLTEFYAAIPAEMQAVAQVFGKKNLRQIASADEDALALLLQNAQKVRTLCGDRALLRALHFFTENIRVDALTQLLIDAANDAAATETKNKSEFMHAYLRLVQESGDSSLALLQNADTYSDAKNQQILLALSLTKNFLRTNNAEGAVRVHGGGFAGTVQAYIPCELFDGYKTFMQHIFGENSVTELFLTA
ncbi:MAG: galactokinase [Treponemataceae bacterium]|nr:MAG: galactokinase [Treponemataceae bacterium]